MHVQAITDNVLVYIALAPWSRFLGQRCCNSHLKALNQKTKTRVRKIVCLQIWGRKWLHQFYGRLDFCFLPVGENLHAHKIPRLGGGDIWVFLGGGVGKCQFYFYGRGDFSDSRTSLFTCVWTGVCQHRIDNDLVARLCFDLDVEARACGGEADLLWPICTWDEEVP